jgi:hypothetical protein
MFADTVAQPECAGLVEDAFGDMKCQIVINPAILEKGWHEHFGYLRALGYAVCVGEFGGNMDWPNKSESRHQKRYSYLTNKNSDEQWQNAFVNYLIKEGVLSSFYWSINPESADTYGIFNSPYDPISNKAGWGTWTTTDSRKTTLLKKLWDATEPAHPGNAPVINPQHATVNRDFTCHVSSAGQINYSLPKAGFVSLKIFNVNGRLESEIISQHQEAGTYSINKQHLVSAAGSYLVMFKAGEYSNGQIVYLRE